MGRRQTTETKFEKIAKKAGFVVRPGKSIRIDSPVNNKLGIRRKKVTTPDFFVSDRATGLEVHVEITNSSGNTPHKKAQKEVVSAAGIKNYVVITGDHIAQLEKLLSSKEQKKLLLQFFHLALLS